MTQTSARLFVFYENEPLPGYAKRTVSETHRGEYLHVLLMGRRAGYMVDHENLNKLDNRRTNLRWALSNESNRNRGKPKNNTSGYKGVHWHKQRQAWQACITVDYRRISLGLYDDPEEAAYAYDAAARKMHGPFAKTNCDADSPR